ncbi:MAG: A/G-specific adenine glycosylase [Gammaproteobacteria bacterium]
MSAGLFSERVLDWYRQHGRQDLPWQRNPVPYRVWVSEIMLQQTQVATVIPYYQRFMDRFPDLTTLAAADQDQVLHYWSGLGYYARARHLHAAAQQIVDRYAGRFPELFDAVVDLPGIGPSTAGAILSLACGQRHPILDGNVKRVLARYHTIDGWPGNTRVQKILWELADRHTPARDVAAYTQAIMDLGATLCTRSQPACSRCPIRAGCAACATGSQADYPAPRPKKSLPVREVVMLLIANEQDELLLEKRPPSGVWGGLWGFPELETSADLNDWCKSRLGLRVRQFSAWPVLRHTFSHFHLDITPVHAEVSAHSPRVMEGAQRLWYKPEGSDERGLAAPVAKLIQQFGSRPQARIS